MEFSSPPLAPKLCAIPYDANLDPEETLLTLYCKQQKIINYNNNNKKENYITIKKK